MKPPKTLELLAHLKLHLLHVIYISEAITCCVSCDLNIMNIQAILISDVVSFSALNYPLKVNVKDHVNKHRNKHTMRSHPSTSSSTSSVQQSLLATETDDKKNSSETQKTYSCQSPPRSSLSQENTVGIIGGVSVLSTLIFLEKLVFRSSRGGGESVPFIVCSGFDQDQDQDQGQTGVVENLRHKRVFLEQGGARCIVMPCHLSHAWYGEISQGCTLPFLHLAESVAMQLKEARFKPLEAGSRVKIGLIATDATLMAGVYQDMLQNQGFEVVFPDKATMDHIINPAIKSLNRKDNEGACNLLRIAIHVLLVRAVNTVILASDELQGLLPHDDPLSKKCIDPIDSLVTSAIRWAKSAKVHQKNPYDT